MLFFGFCIVVTLFSFVLLFGAPYLPTKNIQAQTALDLLNLKPGQTLYEFGSGDGRVLKAAAKRKLNAVGYELNPLLVIFAYFYTWRYRKQVKVIWGNFWKADVSKADGIFVFLLDRFMTKLDNKLQAERTRPVKLASFAFKIPGKKSLKFKNGIFLYQY